MKPLLVKVPTFHIPSHPTISLSQVARRRYDLMDRNRPPCEHGSIPGECKEPECVVRQVIES